MPRKTATLRLPEDLAHTAKVVARASRLDLLDAALHAPRARFGDDDFYPDFATKAAVLAAAARRQPGRTQISTPFGSGTSHHLLAAAD